MTVLTETLSFDELLPLDQQPAAVHAFVGKLLQTPPTTEESEACAPGLSRPVKSTWQLGTAEVVRFVSYQYPASSAACFATAGITLTLRPRLV